VSHAKDVNTLTATSVHQTTNWWVTKKMQYRPAMNTILHKLVEPLGAKIKCLTWSAVDWNLNSRVTMPLIYTRHSAFSASHSTTLDSCPGCQPIRGF